MPAIFRGRVGVAIRLACGIALTHLPFVLAIAPAPAAAQTATEEAPAQADRPPGEEVVSYAPEFFERYRPDSALDMIARVPGFQIDDGGDKRGFGGAVGNILINGRYPSAKQDTPSSILDRIPASQVERIDILREQQEGIELRGHTVIANVILRKDIPATGRWDLGLRQSSTVDPTTIQGNLSLSDQSGAIQYVVGLYGRRFRSGETGSKILVDPDNVPLQNHHEHSLLRGSEGTANLNALTWIGQTKTRMNVTYGFENRHEALASIRPAGATVGTDDYFLDTSELRQLELGGDAERSLREDLRAKAILLYTRGDKDASSFQYAVDQTPENLSRVADTTTLTTEGIARLEFDWTRWSHHSIQFNVEGARNVIDNSLVQRVNTGTDFEVVPVPGANTRVEERRGDFLIGDTWSLDKFELDYGLGAETSTISQTGDAEQKRNFFFLKPHFVVSYSPRREWQTKLRLAREVSQLDFADFVSATLFQDDDLALGNPDLKPETTWVAELSGTRRFGGLGVVSVKLFHDWISDVEDLLPLTPTFEVPGNIGDGRRWGVEIESTVPLEPVGLTGARLDVRLRLQDSTVTDPVTGLDRMLSGESGFTKPIPFRNENHYAYGISFRQDLAAARVAWGWDLRRRGKQARFKVDELDIYKDGTELNLFVDTTRWFDKKINLSLENILNYKMYRYRTFFVGERGITPMTGRELHDRIDGRRLVLTVTGTF